MSAAVRIEGLSKSFEGRLVLDGVGLEVESGRIVTIIGQSGGGKTTLLRCVNLLERPDRGLLEIGGEAIFAGERVVSRDLARLRQRVGMVFQRFNLFPHLTAVENVMLAQVKAARVAEDAAMRRAVSLLQRVGLAHRATAYPEQMSGGEQQRVAIARALVHAPKLLLADEPTGNLDDATAREVLPALLDLTRARGTTLLIVTHDEALAGAADRVLELRDGQLHERVRTAQAAAR
jgi:polar amino acid transport system ATP-binding protein